MVWGSYGRFDLFVFLRCLLVLRYYLEGFLWICSLVYWFLRIYGEEIWFFVVDLIFKKLGISE